MDAVQRTLSKTVKSDKSDFMVLLKSPAMPIFSLTIMTVTLATLLVLIRGTVGIIRLAKRKKIK